MKTCEECQQQIEKTLKLMEELATKQDELQKTIRQMRMIIGMY